MIMGFPGSTQRYMTSYEIDKMLEVDNPQRIFIRGERQRILREDMDASDKVRIQYASKYAQSSNYWKNSIGMSRGIGKLNVKAKKEAEERAFTAWAEAETLPGERFREALPMIREACAALTAPRCRASVALRGIPPGRGAAHAGPLLPGQDRDRGPRDAPHQVPRVVRGLQS